MIPLPLYYMMLFEDSHEPGPGPGSPLIFTNTGGDQIHFTNSGGATITFTVT